MPSRELTDVTLVSEDSDVHEDPDNPDDHDDLDDHDGHDDHNDHDDHDYQAIYQTLPMGSFLTKKFLLI